jgi:hypothetical protein
LDQPGLGRVLEGSVAEEGPDGRQPQITASGAVAPLLFQLIEKGADQPGVQIGERQRRRQLFYYGVEKHFALLLL